MRAAQVSRATRAAPSSTQQMVPVRVPTAAKKQCLGRLRRGGDAPKKPPKILSTGETTNGYWLNDMRRADMIEYVKCLKECGGFYSAALSNRSFKRHTVGFADFFTAHCGQDIKKTTQMLDSIKSLVVAKSEAIEKRKANQMRAQFRANLTITGPQRYRSHTLCGCCKQYIPREQYHDKKTCLRETEGALHSKLLLQISIRQNFSRGTRKVLRQCLGNQCATEHDFLASREKVRDILRLCALRLCSTPALCALLKLTLVCACVHHGVQALEDIPVLRLLDDGRSVMACMCCDVKWLLSLPRMLKMLPVATRHSTKVLTCWSDDGTNERGKKGKRPLHAGIIRVCSIGRQAMNLDNCLVTSLMGVVSLLRVLSAVHTLNLCW